MDILSDVFICGIQTLLITIICTIFELSRFELTTKQLLLIFLIYYLNVGLIVFALFLPMLDWNICAETMHELYMQYGSTLLLSSISIYLLVVVCLIFFSCKILVKIREKIKLTHCSRILYHKTKGMSICLEILLPRRGKN